MFDFFRLDNDYLDAFVKNHLEDQILASGFRPYKGCCRRWHKVVDHFIFSVQFVKNYESAEMYFGFQPLFFPFEFTDARIRLHDKIWTFFDAVPIHWSQQKNHQPVFSRAYVLSPDADQLNGRYFQDVLRKTVLPILNSVQDLESCHEAYRQLRIMCRNSWDARWLMECVALGDTAEIQQIQNMILTKYRDYPKALPLSDERNSATIEPQVLLEVMQNRDYEVFYHYMETSQASNLQRLKRAGYKNMGNTGDGSLC